MFFFRLISYYLNQLSLVNFDLSFEEKQAGNELIKRSLAYWTPCSGNKVQTRKDQRSKCDTQVNSRASHLRTYTHPSEQFSATIYASRDYLDFQLYETSSSNYSSRESITSNSQETSSTGDIKTSDSDVACSENQLSTPASNQEHMEIVPGNVWLGDSNIMAKDSSSNKEHQAPSCHQQNTNDNLNQVKAKYKDVPKDVLRSRKRYRNEIRDELVAGYSDRDTMVVIDNSNIFIGARETACAANSKLRQRHIKVRLQGLVGILEKGKSVTKRFAGGSSPPANEQVWEIYR